MKCSVATPILCNGKFICLFRNEMVAEKLVFLFIREILLFTRKCTNIMFRQNWNWLRRRSRFNERFSFLIVIFQLAVLYYHKLLLNWNCDVFWLNIVILFRLSFGARAAWWPKRYYYGLRICLLAVFYIFMCFLGFIRYNKTFIACGYRK